MAENRQKYQKVKKVSSSIIIVFSYVTYECILDAFYNFWSFNYALGFILLLMVNHSYI